MTVDQPLPYAFDVSNEITIMDANAIRDTNAHYSDDVDNEQFIPKTFIIQNGLDVDVTVQVQGDRVSPFTNTMQLGGSFVVPAGEQDYAAMTDYLKFMRVCVTANSTPTSGDLSIFAYRIRP